MRCIDLLVFIGFCWFLLVYIGPIGFYWSYCVILVLSVSIGTIGPIGLYWSYWFLLVILVSIGPNGFYLALVSIVFNWFQLALFDFNGILIGPIGPIRL